jgi:hypothetical protein
MHISNIVPPWNSRQAPVKEQPPALASDGMIRIAMGKRPGRDRRRRLVIVARDEVDLYSSLVADLSDPLTDVMFDRRFGQRRRPLAQRVPERRRSDRRRVDIAALLNSRGYAIVDAARPRGGQRPGREG